MNHICSNGLVNFIADRTMVGTGINPVTGVSTDMILAGFYAVDAVLSSSEITSIFRRMELGQDPLDPCGCPSGQYMSQLTSTCTNPPANAYAPDDISFECNAGYSEPVVADACSECAAGKYTAGAGVACTTCPVEMTSPPGATGISMCRCGPGTQGNLSCSICPTHTYKPGTLGSCVPAPANAFTPNTVSFLCNAGYSEPVVSNACSACAAGKYKDAVGNQDCQVCPPDSLSLAASTSCTCNNGFVKVPVTGQCVLFVLRTIASSPTNFAGTRILSCPPGHVSPADSTSLADCVCAPGFSPAGWTETTQDFMCIGAWGHAMQSEQLTCLHADGSVKPFVFHDVGPHRADAVRPNDAGRLPGGSGDECL